MAMDTKETKTTLDHAMAQQMDRLSDLHRHLRRSEFVTPGEKTCADALLEMAEVLISVASICAREIEAVKGVAYCAANEASCLANGIKPD